MSLKRTRLGAISAGLMTVALSTGVGCTDDGNSERFCNDLKQTTPIGDLLRSIDTSDPIALARKLDVARAEFSLLESGAPGSIRPSIARIREGVELIFEVIQQNRADPAEVRQVLEEHSNELIGLADPGRKVEEYARTECKIDLGAAVTTSEPPVSLLEVQPTITNPDFQPSSGN